MKINRHNFHDFASAYESFDDIPERYRLERYESDYSGVDVWEQFFEDHYGTGEDWSDSHILEVSRAGERWHRHCNEHECHHALASPKIVDQWCQKLVPNMKFETARSNYLSYINHFYRYLKWNVDFPHIYNPVQFAVQSHETTSKVWNSKAYEDYE